MPIRSGFFNSVNGDRRYQADFFAMFFGTLIGNGVFPNPSTGLQVLANQNMTVTIKPGKGWINGYFFVNDSDYNLTIENADGVLNRIDRIVLQLNFLNREIVPVVKKGTFASSPVAPTLKRDADAYEIALADIYVGKGVLSISQANITDVRLNKDLCGIVKGLIDQVDTTTIFNQYQAWFANITGSTQTEIDTWKTQQEQDFDTWEEGRKSEFQTWFDSIQSILDGDVAANLASRISNLENDVARHKADDIQHVKYGAATGTANTYAVTLNPAPIAYVEGMAVAFKVPVASTTASTLNVNGLGAKGIKKANGTDVTNLKAGGIYTVRYDGTAFILQGEGGEYGTVQAGDVRNTKTFGTENGIQQGALDLSKLVPSNIKQGITIDGVSGTVVEGGMDIPNNTSFQYNTITGIDSDGNYYALDLSVTDTRGKKFSRNMTLLNTYIPETGNRLRGISKHGYTYQTQNDRSDIRVKDLNGNLLTMFSSGSYYLAEQIGSVRNNQFACINTDGAITVWTFDGTLKNNLQVSGDSKLILNKKNRFVYMSYYASTPSEVGRIEETVNAVTKLTNMNPALLALDFPNW